MAERPIRHAQRIRSVVKTCKEKPTNLVPRAHVSFGQHQALVLTKGHVGSGNQIENRPYNSHNTIIINPTSILSDPFSDTLVMKFIMCPAVTVLPAPLSPLQI